VFVKGGMGQDFFENLDLLSEFVEAPHHELWVVLLNLGSNAVFEVFWGFPNFHWAGQGIEC